MRWTPGVAEGDGFGVPADEDWFLGIGHEGLWECQESMPLVLLMPLLCWPPAASCPHLQLS